MEKFPLGAIEWMGLALTAAGRLHSVGSLGGGGLLGAARAQDPNAPASGGRTDQTTHEEQRLPADVTTHHSVELPGRALQFAATAGAILLRGENNAPRLELAFVAFQLHNVDPAHRPVTFAFNGGLALLPVGSTSALWGPGE